MTIIVLCNICVQLFVRMSGYTFLNFMVIYLWVVCLDCWLAYVLLFEEFSRCVHAILHLYSLQQCMNVWIFISSNHAERFSFYFSHPPICKEWFLCCFDSFRLRVIFFHVVHMFFGELFLLSFLLFYKLVIWLFLLNCRNCWRVLGSISYQTWHLWIFLSLYQFS